MVGPGLAIDTDRWFVVCPNVLGGCQGSTGPSSRVPRQRHSRTARGSRSSRSATWCAPRLASPTHLGVARWHAVVGGSMGGMQALEWAVMYPHRVRSIVPIADVHAGHRAADRVGCDRPAGDPPRSERGTAATTTTPSPATVRTKGLGVARMVAQVTFRSDNVFTDRFGRELADRAAVGDTFGLWQEFEVERYLEHHGDKLVRRFDANSYLIIGKAMDLHDVARGRGGVEPAMAGSAVPTLTIGISSDMLYPSYQQRQIHELLTAPRHAVASTSRSTRRTGTTPF